jgi:hypothetical protein
MRPLGPMRPPSRNFPSPATVRPQAFSASRRFHPRYSSWAYFIPQPRSGFRPAQGLLPPHSHPTSSAGACPLVVEVLLAHQPKPDATNKTSQLRGFHPYEDAFLQFGVTRPGGRSPLQVHAPPGVQTPAMASAYPKPTTHDVVDFVSFKACAPKVTPSTRLQRLVTGVPDSSISRKISPLELSSLASPTPKSQLAVGPLRVL